MKKLFVFGKLALTISLCISVGCNDTNVLIEQHLQDSLKIRSLQNKIDSLFTANRIYNVIEGLGDVESLTKHPLTEEDVDSIIHLK